MRRITDFEAELLAVRFRKMINLPQDAPFIVKSVLEQLHIITVYRPLSENSYGFSIKAGEDQRFILVSSETTVGRQHFTIAHELYHLYFDENPRPHMCRVNGKTPEEQSADLFATHLLLPSVGLLSMLPEDYPANKKIDALTLVKMEQRFGVSHQALVYRLRRLGVIKEEELSSFLEVPFRDIAKKRGMDTSIYDKGNEGVVIGDYYSLATDLFEKGLISEGHYIELTNILPNVG